MESEIEFHKDVNVRVFKETLILGEIAYVTTYTIQLGKPKSLAIVTNRWDKNGSEMQSNRNYSLTEKKNV